MIAASGIPVLDMAANTADLGKLVADRDQRHAGRVRPRRCPSSTSRTSRLPPAVETGAGPAHLDGRGRRSRPLHPVLGGRGDDPRRRQSGRRGAGMGAGIGAGMGMAMGAQMARAGPGAPCPPPRSRCRRRTAATAVRACLAHRRGPARHAAPSAGPRWGGWRGDGEITPRDLCLDRRARTAGSVPRTWPNWRSSSPSCRRLRPPMPEQAARRATRSAERRNAHLRGGPSASPRAPAPVPVRPARLTAILPGASLPASGPARRAYPASTCGLMPVPGPAAGPPPATGPTTAHPDHALPSGPFHG